MHPSSLLIATVACLAAPAALAAAPAPTAPAAPWIAGVTDDAGHLAFARVSAAGIGPFVSVAGAAVQDMDWLDERTLVALMKDRSVWVFVDAALDRMIPFDDAWAGKADSIALLVGAHHELWLEARVSEDDWNEVIGARRIDVPSHPVAKAPRGLRAIGDDALRLPVARKPPSVAVVLAGHERAIAGQRRAAYTRAAVTCTAPMTAVTGRQLPLAAPDDRLTRVRWIETDPPRFALERADVDGWNPGALFYRDCGEPLGDLVWSGPGRWAENRDDEAITRWHVFVGGAERGVVDAVSVAIQPPPR